ncbi:MAG: nitroreductase family protein [Caldimonas sp.]
MNTLTKLALGLMGQLKPRPVPDAAAIVLPPPRRSGGMALTEALQRRASTREFDEASLDEQLLSDLLWSAAGINRPEVGGRTAPSAMNSQEVQLHVATPQGLFRYDPAGHALQLLVASDVRRVTGYQDFVDTAPLDLVYVADHAHMKLVPAAQRDRYAFAAAGAMAQNVYLFCAANGLATVIRAWFDHRALSAAMGLQADEQLLLCQTVGRVRTAGRR